MQFLRDFHLAEDETVFKFSFFQTHNYWPALNSFDLYSAGHKKLQNQFSNIFYKPRKDLNNTIKL